MSASTSKMPAANLVMVRAKDVVSLLKCHICFKIQRNSTSIIECSHNFCKKCIIKKLTEEKLNSCPICNTDLGCNPLRKLRPNHNFQGLAATLFPPIEENTEGPDFLAREATETVAAQAEDEESEKPSIQKRKKRSLSSFVNTPSISFETHPTGKRKPVPKKFPSFISSEEELANIVGDSPQSPKSLIYRKNARNKKQLNISEPFKQQTSCQDAGQSNAWDLNCLSEAVDTTKGSKPYSQGIVFKTPPSTIPTEKTNVSKDKGMECGNTSNYIILDEDDDDEDGEEDPKPALVPPTSVKQKGKARGSQRRFVAPSEGVRISAQAVVDANASANIGVNVVWLSLLATCRQDVGPPLLQIPNCYLRIKDIHSPVSLIKKYIVCKLNLQSEDEVEIELLGRPLPSNMEIYKVAEMWGQAVSERILTSVGNSARDLVIALTYSRKS